jgi:hypothetical protein
MPDNLNVAPIQFLDRSLRGDIPLTEHNQLIADTASTGHVVRYNDNGGVSRGLETEEQCVDFLCGNRIQPAARFIHKQYRWIECERTREADSLSHAAGQFQRHLVEIFSRPTAANRAFTAFMMSSSDMDVWRRSGNATFSATVMESNRAEY